MTHGSFQGAVCVTNLVKTFVAFAHAFEDFDSLIFGRWWDLHCLETLQHVLALPALPRRIECFDISTIQGSETVAAMVVCEDGRMRRA